MSVYRGPYPSWGAPTEESCQLVAERLLALHGPPSAARKQGREERRSVLDCLVRTMLSQNTTDKTSAIAFATLKLRFPTWEAVRAAALVEVASAIRVGGLADIKAGRIQAILSAVAAERGECSLEHLRRLSAAQAKAELLRFKGVGKKTAACVLLFSLEVPEFAVDTHVHEICKALGWCPINASRDQAYDHLNELVPDALKYDLHVLMVRHGKQCPACAKAGSRKHRNAVQAGSSCPLADLKPPANKLKAAPVAGVQARRRSAPASADGGTIGAAEGGPGGDMVGVASSGAATKRRKLEMDQ